MVEEVGGDEERHHHATPEPEVAGGAESPQTREEGERPGETRHAGRSGFAHGASTGRGRPVNESPVGTRLPVGKAGGRDEERPLHVGKVARRGLFTGAPGRGLWLADGEPAGDRGSPCGVAACSSNEPAPAYSDPLDLRRNSPRAAMLGAPPPQNVPRPRACLHPPVWRTCPRASFHRGARPEVGCRPAAANTLSRHRAATRGLSWRRRQHRGRWRGGAATAKVNLSAPRRVPDEPPRRLAPRPAPPTGRGPLSRFGRPALG